MKKQYNNDDNNNILEKRPGRDVFFFYCRSLFFLSFYGHCLNLFIIVAPNDKRTRYR